MQSQPMRNQRYYVYHVYVTSARVMRDPVETWIEGCIPVTQNNVHHSKQGGGQTCKEKVRRCSIQGRQQLWGHIHWRDMQNPGSTSQGTQESSQNTTQQQWHCSSHKQNRQWHPVKQCTCPRVRPHVVKKEIQRSTLDPSWDHHHEPSPGSLTQLY